jgi:hypothetical protein
VDRVVVPEDAVGLPRMLADLVIGNLERDPARADLLAEPGSVNLTVSDVDITLGLLFGDGKLEITDPLDDPELTFDMDSERLMAITAVPLRFGMPDQLTKDGRQVSGWLLNGTIKVKGLPKQLPLMIRLQRLFTVSK